MILCIRRKILARFEFSEISIDEWNSIFQIFEHTDNLTRYSQIFGNFFLTVIFLLELSLDFFFVLQKFNNSLIFWNLSHEIFVPLVPFLSFFNLRFNGILP